MTLLSSALFIPLWAGKLQPPRRQPPPWCWAASSGRRMDTAEEQSELSPMATSTRVCLTQAGGDVAGSAVPRRCLGCFQVHWQLFKQPRCWREFCKQERSGTVPSFLTCLWVLDSVWTPKRLVIAMLSDRIRILHLFWNYKYHRELGCASTNRSCCFKEDELQWQQVLFFNLTPSVCMKRTQQSKFLNDKLSNWSYHAMNRLSSRPDMNLRGSRRQECTTLIMEKLGCCVKVNRNAM